MTPDPPGEGSGPRLPLAGKAWVRPLALVVACLVIGFVGGWMLRGDGGPVTVIAPQGSNDGPPADTAGRPTTQTAPATSPGTETAPPERSEIVLAVLNGTGTAGLAATNASKAESLGYQDVATGNAPSGSGPSVVYYRAGNESAAQRVSQDMQVAQVQPLPASGPLTDAAPETAEVVLVLGPG